MPSKPRTSRKEPARKSAGPGRPPGDRDLRRDLLRAGIALLKEETLEKLTMRKVASAAGVSHVATYHHFENKSALLAAIAEEGFRQFLGEYEAGEPGDPADFEGNMRFLGWAYVCFIIEHPQQSRIMFGGSYLDYDRHPGVRALSLRTYRTLRRIIAQGQAAGKVGPGDGKARTVASWSMIHGMAMLLLEKRLAPGASLAATREMALGVTRYLYTGLAT